MMIDDNRKRMAEAMMAESMTEADPIRKAVLQEQAEIILGDYSNQRTLTNNTRSGPQFELQVADQYGWGRYLSPAVLLAASVFMIVSGALWFGVVGLALSIGLILFIRTWP